MLTNKLFLFSGEYNLRNQLREENSKFTRKRREKKEKLERKERGEERKKEEKIKDKGREKLGKKFCLRHTLEIY